MKFKEVLKIIRLPVVFASLCCLTPIVLVLLGLSGVIFASSLSDTLYGSYKWAFRAFGLGLLGISLLIYFRSKGICTLDQAKRQKRKIINTALVVLLVAVVGYIVFLYVIVEIVGSLLGIW